VVIFALAPYSPIVLALPAFLFIFLFCMSSLLLLSPCYREPGETAGLPEVEQAEGNDQQEDVEAVPFQPLPCCQQRGHSHHSQALGLSLNFKM
jgi:hypothetical protein